MGLPPNRAGVACHKEHRMSHLAADCLSKGHDRIRSAGIAALEREIDELSRVQEALVEATIARGEPINESAAALP